MKMALVSFVFEEKNGGLTSGAEPCGQTKSNGNL